MARTAGHRGSKAGAAAPRAGQKRPVLGSASKTSTVSPPRRSGKTVARRMIYLVDRMDLFNYLN